MQPNPFLPQQPAAAPAQQQQNPYQQQPQNPYQQPSAPPQQVQYGSPAGAPGLVAQPGQYVKPGAPPPPGSDLPRISDLNGRLLIVMPERLERGVPSNFKNQDGSVKLQDKMTATVVVLDGGPLQWGGSPVVGAAAPKTATIPHVIKGLWIQQRNLIVQLEPAHELRQRGGPGLALGRLWKTGNAQNDPYVLAEPQPQDEQLYNQYVSQVNPFTL